MILPGGTDFAELTLFTQVEFGGVFTKVGNAVEISEPGWYEMSVHGHCTNYSLPRTESIQWSLDLEWANAAWTGWVGLEINGFFTTSSQTPGNYASAYYERFVLLNWQPPNSIRVTAHTLTHTDALLANLRFLRIKGPLPGPPFEVLS